MRGKKTSILEEAKKSERDILISAEEESKKIKEESIREIKKKTFSGKTKNNQSNFIRNKKRNSY